MTQTYAHPLAIARMREGKCPECGGTPEGHGNDNRFWMPGNQHCALMEAGVVDRIDRQHLLDAAARAESAAAQERSVVEARALADDDATAHLRPEPTEEEAAAVWGPRDVDDAGPEESR